MICDPFYFSYLTYIYKIIKDVVLLWNYCLFFNNLFLSLKVYFEQFIILKLITFYLLGKNEIERRKTKMKKMPNMDGVPDIL